MSQPISIEITADRRWTPVHVRSRCEKVVADFCRVCDLPHYLPLRRRARRYQRRLVETWLPMFPSYVFVQLGEGDAERLARCNRIATFLRVTPAAEVGLVGELRSLQCLEQSALTDSLVVSPELVPGRPVTVKRGPMRGAEGIVQRRAGKTRIVINITILGQSVSAEVEAADLEGSG